MKEKKEKEKNDDGIMKMNRKHAGQQEREKQLEKSKQQIDTCQEEMGGE